jgi:hypothetical protein
LGWPLPQCIFYEKEKAKKKLLGEKRGEEKQKENSQY